MIQEERIMVLSGSTPRAGAYVLYWMQAAHRVDANHALAYAVQEANRLGLPVLAYFGLAPSYPGAAWRHYHFMLEGLKEAGESLDTLGIKLVIRPGDPVDGLWELAKDAALVVVDTGYLRLHREWVARAQKTLRCPFIRVESNAIVPVMTASPHEEYSAATFRPKILRALGRFLVDLQVPDPKKRSTALELDSLELGEIEQIRALLDIDTAIGPVDGFSGGTAGAISRLTRFIDTRLDSFPEERNDPSLDCLSNMSPYLHFGQVSPLRIALMVSATGNGGRDAYLEELVVRRELAINFVWYNPQYDSYSGLPDWCRKTLESHAKDRREHVYSLQELESARTHDPFWNAAQDEMRIRGKMHRYMRMYWGKKILEWSADPESAYNTAMYLNDRYELDGRDPNGYAGVAWCFGKHDRPWKERPIFGKIRYMNARGLSRKFDMGRYIEVVDRMRKKNQ